MAAAKNQYLNFQNTLSELERGEPRPVYLARGNDYYLYRQFVTALRKAFIKKYGENAEIIQRWGAELKAAADLSFISGGGGLFSSASLIILNEIQDSGQAVKPSLSEIIGGISGETVVLIHYAVNDFRKAKWLGNLERISYGVALQSPQGEELPAYVTQMSAGYGLELSNRAILHLIELSAGELAIIDNELQKMSLYLGEEKGEVDEKLVDQIAGSVENAQVAQFIEAFSQRNRGLAIRTLVEINSRGKEGLPFIVAMLYNRLIQLMTLHEKIDVRNTMGQGVTSYYFLKDLNAVSRNYSLEELKAATQELAEIDYQFRLGSSDMLTSMSTWVSKVV